MNISSLTEPPVFLPVDARRQSFEKELQEKLLEIHSIQERMVQVRLDASRSPDEIKQLLLVRFFFWVASLAPLPAAFLRVLLPMLSTMAM